MPISPEIPTTPTQEETATYYTSSFKNTSDSTTNYTATSTEDFINTSLAELDRMLKNIKDQKETHLHQAEVYKQQKESFAQQEIDEKNRAHGLDGEIAHIEEMRSYLEEQKSGKGNAAKNSVKTTLTGISVQHNVEDAISKKPARRTSKKPTVT